VCSPLRLIEGRLSSSWWRLSLSSGSAIDGELVSSSSSFLLGPEGLAGRESFQVEGGHWPHIGKRINRGGDEVGGGGGGRGEKNAIVGLGGCLADGGSVGWLGDGRRGDGGLQRSIKDVLWCGIEKVRMLLFELHEVSFWFGLSLF